METRERGMEEAGAGEMPETMSGAAVPNPVQTAMQAAMQATVETAMETAVPNEMVTAAPADTAELHRAAVEARGQEAPRAVRGVGRYAIVRKLGEGGMGSVYLAEQQEPVKRLVALKMIRGGVDSKEILVRFASERQALARLDHPNIAKLLDAGTGEYGLPYFVMEYVEGKPLTAMADELRLPIRERLELFVQACEAIAHAHARALLHRDIKDTNVLGYLADGRPSLKVIDFGIAKALGEERLAEVTMTLTGGSTGTPHAMSPEQADGLADIDTRTDVYALGVLLYELLCGAKPFDPKVLSKLPVTEMLRVIREQEPARPSQRLADHPDREAIARARSSGAGALVRELGRELDWIPLKALRKDRERRYASAQQMADDIRAYLANRPLIAAPESRVYRSRKFISRHWAPLATAAAVTVAAVVGVTVYTVKITRANERLERANRATAEATVSASMLTSRQAENIDTPGGALGQIARNIDELGLFREDPVQRATMKARLGEALLVAKQMQAADVQLRQAIHDLEQLKLADREPLYRALDALGDVQFGLKNYAEAARLFDRAIEGWRGNQQGADRWRLGSSLGKRARTAQATGDAGGAATCFAEAMEIFRQENLEDEGRSEFMQCLSRYGGFLLRRDPVLAEQLLLESASIAEGITPGRHYADTLNNLGILYSEQGRPAEAVSALERALALYIAFNDRKDDITLRARASLASAQRGAGDLAGAEKNYRAAIEGMRGRPSLASDLANAQSGLGRTLARVAGREMEAEELLLAALSWRLEHEPGSAERTARPLAELYRSRGRTADAEAVLARLRPAPAPEPAPDR